MSTPNVVLVTGVSSGIGAATAEQFAKMGSKVFGSVRDLTTARAIPAVEFVEMDVRVDASVKRAIEIVIGKAGRAHRRTRQQCGRDDARRSRGNVDR